MSVDVYKHIIERFEKVRVYHANKAQFAVDIGMERQTLMNFVKGRVKNPGVLTLVPIADYFGVSLDELIGRENPGKSFRIKPSFLSQDIEFNEKLFVQISDVVCSCIGENNISISFDKVLSGIDAIYDYSTKQKMNEPDMRFAKWIMERLFS